MLQFDVGLGYTESNVAHKVRRYIHLFVTSELVSDVLGFILARTHVALFSWQAICTNPATHVNRSLGAEAVLGTLWLANPDAIGELLALMADCYRNEGATWVQVLTKAQRDLIEGTTFSNPWFWAPYQLIGRWR
jgi:hypothetical protein